jgi:hypothetical protein
LDIVHQLRHQISSRKQGESIQADHSLSALVTPYDACPTDSLHEIDSSMGSSADMTNTDKHLSSSPSTDNNHSQSRQHPAAMQKWLEERPHEEPWTTCSRKVERHSTPEGGKVQKELEQDFAQDLPHGIDGNKNRSADMADTAKPLLYTPLAQDKPSQTPQPPPAAVKRWLKEAPHEEP